MNVLTKNIVVVVAGFLSVQFAPWFIVGPVLPLMILLFVGFLWANWRIYPQVTSRKGRTVAITLMSLVCTAGIFVPLMMAMFPRSEKMMWKSMINQMDELFPYEVTGADSTVQRMSGTNDVNMSTHSVRRVTNSTWEAMQENRRKPQQGGGEERR